MIIETQHNDVQTSGSFIETTNGQIIANAQMIRLLSSGLYQDKIMAVLRELSANAIDAHKEANTQDIPFEIHLPTLFENWFSIRDYGTGLSDEGMKRVYINYGASTKSNTNTMIGGFGIGSKSVLAYTNDCVITSFHEGTQSVYNFGLNDEGMPVLSKVLSTVTDEPNGLLIKMVTKSEDRYDFKQKAENLYTYFENRPEVNINLNYDEPEILTKGSFWTHYKKSYGTVQVLMGNVLYRVSITSLMSAHAGTSFYLADLIMKLNIGEVDVTASRESLELTPRTLEVLDQKFKQIKEEYNKLFLDAYNPLNSTFTNFCNLSKIMGDATSTIRHLDFVVPSAFKNGVTYTNISEEGVEYVLPADNTNRYTKRYISHYANKDKDFVYIRKPSEKKPPAARLSEALAYYNEKHGTKFSRVVVLGALRDGLEFSDDQIFNSDKLKDFLKSVRPVRVVQKRDTTSRAPQKLNIDIDKVYAPLYRQPSAFYSAFTDIGGTVDAFDSISASEIKTYKKPNVPLYYCTMKNSLLATADGSDTTTPVDNKQVSYLKYSAITALSTILGSTVYGVPKTYVKALKPFADCIHVSDYFSDKPVELYDVTKVIEYVHNNLRFNLISYRTLMGYINNPNFFVPYGLSTNRLVKFLQWLDTYKTLPVGNTHTQTVLKELGINSTVTEVNIPEEFMDLDKQFLGLPLALDSKIVSFTFRGTTNQDVMGNLLKAFNNNK